MFSCSLDCREHHVSCTYGNHQASWLMWEVTEKPILSLWGRHSQVPGWDSLSPVFYLGIPSDCPHPMLSPGARILVPGFSHSSLPMDGIGSVPLRIGSPGFHFHRCSGNRVALRAQRELLQLFHEEE